MDWDYNSILSLFILLLKLSQFWWSRTLSGWFLFPLDIPPSLLSYHVFFLNIPFWNYKIF
jgi:hypothetical protein